MGKWPFFDKNYGLTPLEKSQFFDFFNFFFYGLEKRFYVLEYYKTYFPGLYCLKKEMEKWPFFDQNRGLTPLKRSQFFDYLKFFFYRLERRFFVVEYYKTHFPALYCLKKKNGNMAIF